MIPKEMIEDLKKNYPAKARVSVTWFLAFSILEGAEGVTSLQDTKFHPLNELENLFGQLSGMSPETQKDQISKQFIALRTAFVRGVDFNGRAPVSLEVDDKGARIVKLVFPKLSAGQPVSPLVSQIVKLSDEVNGTLSAESKQNHASKMQAYSEVLSQIVTPI